MTEKGAKTRDRILSRATELMIRRGFRATSVNDLVDATGVNRGALYFHFPGKEDLAIAVLKRARDKFLGFVRDGLTGDTPAHKLDNFLRAALEANTARGFVGGCLWGNTALEMADSEDGERFVEVVRDVFNTWRGLIEEVVNEAQDRGQVRRDMPASMLARQVVATLEGAIMQARLIHDPTPMRDCLDALRLMLDLQVPGKGDRKGDES